MHMVARKEARLAILQPMQCYLATKLLVRWSNLFSGGILDEHIDPQKH